MRILIADDDTVSRALLVGILRKCGWFDLIEATDGSAAWAVLEKNRGPCLAILDWLMPGLDGLEVVRRVRCLKIEPPPYLLMLTIRGSKADVVSALDAGADDYLTKPFDAEELRARVGVGLRLLELQASKLRQMAELQEALEHVRMLQGILPICMHCKKVRDDDGYWEQVEAYVSRHADVTFSHGICPECMAKHYPEA